MWQPEARGPGEPCLNLPDVEITGMSHHNPKPFKF